ncbi:MAG: hypothetical protein WCI97_08635 [Bacteroidota bacterium]
MKKIILAIFLICTSLISKAQGLYYNTWCFGDSAMFRYNSGTFDSSIPCSMTSYETCASISDSLGNLLFYTNGIKIFNKLHQQMPNADSINFGPFSPAFGSSTTQGSVILKKPGSSSEYYVFFLIAQLQNPPLHYCIVDMNLDSGNGDVAIKNQYIYNDSLTEKMCAVKHGNGRDWWLYLHKPRENTFVRFLISNQGVSVPYYQTIGSNWFQDDIISQMCISPDGSKLAEVSFDHIDVFNLDRCTGLLSEFKNIVQYQYPNPGTYGCAFSPNDKFLYVSTLDSLLQIPLTVTQSYANRHLVYYEPFANNYYQSIYPITINQLENLDGKIVVACGLVGTLHIHLPPYNTSLSLINQPDSSLSVCDFQPYSIPLQHGTIIADLPNMPNYNLGVLQNSSCDTITTINNQIQKNNF